jgi:hypothetical protein
MKSSPIPDDTAIKGSIADATLNWGRLENALANILEECVRGAPQGVGHAIYFAPNNTETRLYIVDDALRYALKQPMVNDADIIIECWDIILKQIVKRKNSRNKIAHGHIIYTASGESRLSSSLFDKKRLTTATRQLAGMSQNDVKQIAQAFSALTLKLTQFLALLRDAKTKPQDDAFQDTICALINGLTT